MTCPFRQEVTKVLSVDIEGNVLSSKTEYYCTMREMAQCINCTQITISNRNTTSRVTFYRPDGREEIYYGNY